MFIALYSEVSINLTLLSIMQDINFLYVQATYSGNIFAILFMVCFSFSVFLLNKDLGDPSPIFLYLVPFKL